MPQPIKKKYVESRDPAAPLFLGLMIILLAFFIVAEQHGHHRRSA